MPQGRDLFKPTLGGPIVKNSNCDSALEGPKLEISDSMVFVQIRPLWVGDLGIMPKNLKF